MEIQGNCTICLGPLSPRKEETKPNTTEKVAKIGCKHEYHQSCLHDWVLIKAVCPLCAHVITKEEQTDLFDRILNSPKKTPTLEELIASGIDGCMLADIYLP